MNFIFHIHFGVVFSGEMQLGPCPVVAVKEGNVYLPYDTKFVFGEVNADIAEHMAKGVHDNPKFDEYEIIIKNGR